MDTESRAQWTESRRGVAGGSVKLKAQIWDRPKDYMIAHSKPENERDKTMTWLLSVGWGWK